MANKNRKTQVHQANQQKVKQQQYQAATKYLFIFPIIAAVLTLLALLPFFANFAEVYNSQLDNPIEVAVRGWSFFVAGLTGDYSSPDAVYGDLAMPFYYYAQEWCETIAIVSIFAVVFIVLSVAVQAIAAIKKMHGLNLVSAILGLISAVLMIVCYAKGVGMANSDILPIYCSGNPACFIKSYAIISAIILLAATAVSAFAAIKNMKVSKLLK